MVDMKHLEHLEAVAASDVLVLRRKEATYQGSWKAAGGRSAWFMARRNMDRMLVMMRPPKDSHPKVSLERMLESGDVVLSDTELSRIESLLVAEDIFAKIEENPSGADGTVLAVMRDMRRYFTLVEAEMIARGVVVPEDVAPAKVERPNLDELHLVFDGPPGPVGPRFLEAETSEGRSVSVGEWRERKDGNWALVIHVMAPLSPTRYRPPVTVIRVGPGTPEDGGQHADKARYVFPKITPHVIEAGSLTIHFGATELGRRLATRLYTHRTRELVNLEPFLSDAVHYELDMAAYNNALPVGTRDLIKSALGCYIQCEKWHVLDAKLIPPEWRDIWPRLTTEKNATEWADLPAWQQVLYQYDDAGVKWVLRPEHAAWASE